VAKSVVLSFNKFNNKIIYLNLQSVSKSKKTAKDNKAKTFIVKYITYDSYAIRVMPSFNRL